MGFSIGFAWFVLASLVPSLIGLYKASLSEIIMLISLYGYAMVVVSLPAAWWAMKSGPKLLFTTAIVLSVLGLVLRAVSTHYSLLLIGQAIAALAYPMIISPIGAVLKLTNHPRPRALTGWTIGMLFLGMALGALVAPSLIASLGTHGTLWIVALVNAVAGIYFLTALRYLPVPSAQTTIHRPLIITSWSLVGLAVASISVMLGSIAGEALGKLGMSQSNSLALGSLLTALTFLGSALGAIVLASLADRLSKPYQYQKVLAVLTWVALLWVALTLTGKISGGPGGLEMGFFILGALGNGWYAMALEASAHRAKTAGSAGISTAGFSIVSNLGVALIPVYLGPLILSADSLWLTLTLLLMLIAVMVPLLAKHPEGTSRTA